MSGNYGASYCDGPHLADDCPNCVNILGVAVLERTIDVADPCGAHELARHLLSLPDCPVDVYVDDYRKLKVINVGVFRGRVEIDAA
jgi:hypothetical protein